MVLNHTPEHVSLGQVVRNAGPLTAAIFTLQYVGRVIAVLVVVHHDINGIRIEQIGLDVVDEEAVRNARQLVDLPPGLPIVLSHLNEAVIRSCVDKSGHQWRLRQ